LAEYGQASYSKQSYFSKARRLQKARYRQSQNEDQRAGTKHLEIGAGISNNLDTMANGSHGNVFPADGKTMQLGITALDDGNDGCAVLGDAPEIWEVRNDTDEIHNFHIHQSKFKFASEAQIANVTAPQYRATHPRTVVTNNPSATLDADLCNDNRPELAVWHDTIPVEAHNTNLH
jgi:FtsP/CotA-like multicopper oxidase with cupredoxin domain